MLVSTIVLSMSRGMGVEATKLHKRIAVSIADKRNEEYSHVINHLRTRLRFALLKSTVTAVRGTRGKRTKENLTPLSLISFNLIQDQ